MKKGASRDRGPQKSENNRLLGKLWMWGLKELLATPEYSTALWKVNTLYGFAVDNKMKLFVEYF